MMVSASAPFRCVLVSAPWRLAPLRIYHGPATAADLYDARPGERIAWHASAIMVGRFLAFTVSGLSLSYGHSLGACQRRWPEWAARCLLRLTRSRSQSGVATTLPSGENAREHPGHSLRRGAERLGGGGCAELLDCRRPRGDLEARACDLDDRPDLAADAGRGHPPGPLTRDGRRQGCPLGLRTRNLRGGSLPLRTDVCGFVRSLRGADLAQGAVASGKDPLGCGWSEVGRNMASTTLAGTGWLCGWNEPVRVGENPWSAVPAAQRAGEGHPHERPPAAWPGPRSLERRFQYWCQTRTGL